MSIDTDRTSAASPAQLGDDDTVVVPRRHPIRWLMAALVALVAGWLTWVLWTTPSFGWPTVAEYLFAPRVLDGVVNTLVMTAACMVVGIVLGTLVAVMRMSVNPVLKSVASFYQWFFRGTPTLVQLVFWFNLASVFPQIMGIDTNLLMTPFLAATLGLGLNFSAYYSEIVRAGILSVDEGQSDSAAAFGLSRSQTLRRIVLPQAMRVIVPPTGNEVIGMLKWTSLATVVSYGELLHSVQTIYNVNYEIIPLLTVAAIWYLALTTVLSTGQLFLERYVARGSQRNPQPSWIATNGSKVWRKVRSA